MVVGSATARQRDSPAARRDESRQPTPAQTANGLSQTPSAVRRRNQRAVADPVERLVTELQASMPADQPNIAALQASEQVILQNSNQLVAQGAQQLTLATEMVQLLRTLVEGMTRGRGEPLARR